MRADDDFSAFVAQEHEALLRLARLLADDPQDADDLVRRALARVRRRWRGAAGRDPAAAARTALVRRVLDRRPADGPRSSGFVDEFQAAWDADGTEALRRALAELPVRTRTATVLALAEGLPAEEIAALLDDDLDAVRAEVAAGTARLGTALAPAHSGWHAGSAGPPPAADLGRLLADLADRPGTVLPPAALADAARRDAGAARRRWLSGAAACAAVAVAVPVLVQTGSPAAPAAGPTAEPTRRTERPPPPVDVFALPARGSLAEDEQFVAGLRALEWTAQEEWGLPPEYWPRTEDRRVLFAGDVPSGRWALVVGPPATGTGGAVFEDEVVMAWFTGPRGAAPSEMSLSSYPYTVAPGGLPALVDPSTGTMVVLAAPGDVVEVSERPEVGADGSRTRDWERVESDDGVAVARLDPSSMPWMWSVSYRVLREEPFSGTTITGVPDVLVADGEPDRPVLDVRYPQGPPPAPQRRVAEDAAANVLTQLGLDPGDVEITALVTTTLGADRAGELALISVRVPSGAVVLTGTWSRTGPDGTGTTGDCGTDVRPAGPPATERVVAAACEIWDPATGAPQGSVLVVSAPPSVASIRTYDAGGRYRGQHAIRDGWVLVPMTSGATEVEAVTADGVLLGRSDLLHTGMWLGE